MLLMYHNSHKTANPAIIKTHQLASPVMNKTNAMTNTNLPIVLIRWSTVMLGDGMTFGLFNNIDGFSKKDFSILVTEFRS